MLESNMNSIAIMFPVLPNKREQLFRFAADLSVPRAAEYAESQESVQRESWFLQSTPMGDFLIVHFEAPDPAGVFTALAQSTTPFDTWFREQAQEITGIDFTKPGGDLPKMVFKYEKG
jgi:hypothetical protein